MSGPLIPTEDVAAMEAARDTLIRAYRAYLLSTRPQMDEHRCRVVAEMLAELLELRGASLGEASR